jgi:adenosylcobyric acid synthase
LRAAPVCFTEAHGPWAALAGVQAQGYEIRCGRTQAAGALAVLHDAQGQPIGWQQGPVLGVYAHGLFEQSAVLRALFGAEVPTLNQACDTVADLVEEHLDAALLRRLLGR